MLNIGEVSEIIDLAKEKGPTKRGGNSTITRVPWHGQFLAVKDYSARTDGQDRLRREVSGLRFLEQANLDEFPRCVGVDPERSCAVFNWITGDPPAPGYLSVGAMTAVMHRLHRSSSLSAAKEVERAADAIINASDISVQVERRCVKLSTSSVSEVAEFARLLCKSLEGIGSLEVGEACQTLSLSDFGCHNMLLDKSSGRFVFVDLEFFGWDDAHKLVLDTLLHPLSSWTGELASEFLVAAAGIYRLDRDRLNLLATLLAAKWATIVAARAEREALQGDITGSARSIARAQEYLQVALGSGGVNSLVNRRNGGVW